MDDLFAGRVYLISTGKCTPAQRKENERKFQTVGRGDKEMAKRTTIYSISRNYTRCRIWEGDPELIGTSTVTPDRGLTQQQRKLIIETWLRKNGITPKPLTTEKRS